MAEQLPTLLASALTTVLWVSAPAVLAAAAAGALTGVLQAVTRVQDATLAYVPRLLAVSAALFLGGSWMMGRVVSLTTELWQTLP